MITNTDGKPLLLDRPNPLVVESGTWKNGSWINFDSFAPTYIQPPTKKKPTPLPKAEELIQAEEISPIQTQKPINTFEDDLYSGDPDRVWDELKNDS